MKHTLGVLGLDRVDAARRDTARRTALLEAVRTLTAGSTVAEALESGVAGDGTVTAPLAQWSEAELESWLQQQVARRTKPEPPDPALS